MLWRRRKRPRDPSALKPAFTPGNAATTNMQETSRAPASDTTGEPSRPEVVAKLGIEAQAELQRLRMTLGLCAVESAALPTVGRYQLEEEIGQGGMGVVYRAHDPELDRTIAIKLVRARPLGGDHDKLSARLLREAKALAKLTHPNVVRIYDFGSHRGEVFLAMEYVEGQTLRQWQATRDRAAARILDAYLHAADGLAAAHSEGIIHRDFKPDNVFVANDGRFLVGDFGLAGTSRDDDWPAPPKDQATPRSLATTLTRTGSMLGTLVYMAPEQLRGDEVEPRSDQFAFCVSLWEAIAEQRPFAGEDRQSLLSAIAHGDLRGAEEIPRWLHPCLRRGLSEDPAERYSSILELVENIGRVRPFPRRWSSLQIAGASLSAAIISLALWNATSGSTEPETQACELEQSIVDLRSDDSWSALLQRLESASASDGLHRIQDHTLRLQDTAREVCEQVDSVGVGARRQHLRFWLDDLRGLLDSADSRPLSQVLEDVQRLDRARLNAPPPRKIDDAVVNELQISEELERGGRLDEALEAANRAVTKANERPLELAVAHLRRGRVLALRGDHDEAIDAYRHARDEAEPEAYEDVRLRARLLSAKTALMRLEDLEQGERDLDKVSVLLKRIEEPSSSPRDADYHEVLATLLMLRGDYDAAEAHQLQVIATRTEFKDRYETGLAHINLGVIYERRGSTPTELEPARREYEEAARLLGPPRTSPGSVQAAYNLGHWLVQYGEGNDLDEGHRLLVTVRDASDDLRFAASHSLVLGALRDPESTQLRTLAEALKVELETNAPASVSEAFDAWTVLASAWAAQDQTTELDSTFPRIYALAEELVDGGQPKDAVTERVVGLEMTVADLLRASDPPRARELATRAHMRLEGHPNSELSGAIEEFLDQLP